MAGLRISLLGTPVVDVDGAPLAVDTRKAIALLALLAVEGAPRTRDELALLLWPDYDEHHARSSLRRTLSALRSSLAGRWVEAGRDTISLDAWSDVVQFRELAAGVQRHASSAAHAKAAGDGVACMECRAKLREAAGLHRGAFMAGFTLRDTLEFEEWQQQQGERLRRELDAVLEALVRAEVAAGDTMDAIAAAQRRLALDPLSESAHSDLMQLFAIAGDRSAALRQYRACVRVLHDELGVAPLAATTTLYRSILGGEVAAVAPLAARTEPPTRADLEEHRDLPLVGRDRELARLRTAYAAIDGHGRLIVVEGEAGIGKSRLVGELIAHAQAAGARVAVARCYEGERGIAYAAIAVLLRAAAALPDADSRLGPVAPHDLVEAQRLVPGLTHGRSLPEALRLDNAASLARFLDGVASVLVALVAPEGANGAAGLLFVDDIHWADDASVEFLGYLAHRLEARALGLVLTWRTEELPAVHPARRLFAERAGAPEVTRIVLGRLDREAVRALVEARSAMEPPPATVDRLFEETEGLPLFLEQYLAAADDAPRADAGLDAPPGLEPGRDVPAGVRDVLRARLGGVAEADSQLLAAAAVIGRSFDFDVLHRASGRSEEETIAALERLSARGLLRAAAPAPSYDFIHERLRELVYEETSPARRRLLHRRAAEALSNGRRADDAGAGLVANHLLLAGEYEAAAVAFETAGNYARRLQANAQALAHFEAALAAGHPHPASLHLQIGAIHTLSGAYRAALQSYDTAAAIADPEAIAVIEHRIANVLIRLGNWALAAEHLNAALESVAPTAGGQRARIEADRALVAHRVGRDADAVALAELALDLATAAEDGAAIAQGHNMLGMLAASDGDEARAVGHLRDSLAVAQRLGDSEARLAALNNLALALRTPDRAAEALALLETALAVATERGDRHREAAIRNSLADHFREAGRPDDSMAQLKLAVALFAEVGTGADEPEPAIWKLVSW